MAGREPYSPKHRTALILTGTGTAGAYHAGVLRALAEAGVRIDLVAGHGIGAVGAFFTAIEGGAKLWAADGLWRQRAVSGFYPWRTALRLLGWVSAGALLLVLAPLVLLAAGILVYPVAFVLRVLQLSVGTALADGYASIVHEAFQPGRLPTWLAQWALLLALAALALVTVSALRARLPNRHRERGTFWWRVFGAPLSRQQVVRYWQGGLWRLMTGGAKASQPNARELSQRYAEVLADNLGQPGFRELIVVVHDLDTRRDVVLGGLMEPWRKPFFGRRTGAVPSQDRASETLDLTGADRDHAVDVLAASLCLPVATDPWPVTFSPESYWRGETHRLCDRPECVARLLEEAASGGADQVIVVSANASSAAPHTLTEPRIDGRGRIGAWLASQETAAVRDAVRARAEDFRSIHVISPDHNPVGPFDVVGAYDERSDRVQMLGELVDRGYADAYRLFIEPVVGAAESTA